MLTEGASNEHKGHNFNSKDILPIFGLTKFKVHCIISRTRKNPRVILAAECGGDCTLALRVFLDMADTQLVEGSGLEDRREESGLSSDSVNESMSVEEISLFLHRNGIPHRFCEVFEGKMSNLCVH